MPYEGQIFGNIIENNEHKFVIISKNNSSIQIIWDSGFFQSLSNSEFNNAINNWNLLAEYPNWKEAIASKEFKGE